MGGLWFTECDDALSQLPPVIDWSLLSSWLGPVHLGMAGTCCLLEGVPGAVEGWSGEGYARMPHSEQLVSGKALTWHLQTFILLQAYGRIRWVGTCCWWGGFRGSWLDKLIFTLLAHFYEQP